MALSFTLTTRGIPQFYYGTEILMQRDKNCGDAYLKGDLPGGWNGDLKNVLPVRPLMQLKKKPLNLLGRVSNWRKEKDVIHSGKLKQFIPENNLYVCFRYNDKVSVMIILNNSDKEAKTITRERYDEAMNGFTLVQK